MIYLDTHVAVWLYFGNTELIPTVVIEKMEDPDLYLSPMAFLEIQFLHEIKRFTVKPEKIINRLQREFDIKICEKSFHKIIEKSLKINWTRDPFDRIIVAHAALDSDVLLTKDKSIQKHYKCAGWD